MAFGLPKWGFEWECPGNDKSVSDGTLRVGGGVHAPCISRIRLTVYRVGYPFRHRCAQLKTEVDKRGEGIPVQASMRHVSAHSPSVPRRNIVDTVLGSSCQGAGSRSGSEG